MPYSHTQTNPGWVAVVAAALLALSVTGGIASGSVVALIVVLVVALVLVIVIAIFRQLTVEVNDSALTASFGWGWPSKRLELGRASGARIVRNRWWYGFGIRLIPGGTMWNLWGLDAVEFHLDTGKVLRIGTDEPESLLAAVTGTLPQD